MTVQSIMLIGGPDSGKTNYSVRLFKKISENDDSRLVASGMPDNIEYIEELLAHQLQGDFAPRSDTNLDEGRRDFTIPIALSETPNTILTEVIVPDVSGELWKKAVETSELPSEWMEQLKQSNGAFIFARVLSDQNILPLDWVTTAALHGLAANHDEENNKIPTQIFLSELLRFLQHALKPGQDNLPPRVAVLVTAWDLLDEERSKAGPDTYLQAEYPMFAGRLKDTNNLDVRVFGVSSLGGDLSNDEIFRNDYMDGKLNDAGYVVTRIEDETIKNNDLTLPLAWLIRK